ncbi:hypothetical protein NYP18_09075 [Corynebacterium sp. YIM 101645]|uniref:Transposase n=1 Tax=Corynebacterium lemuris TaxID=1859292 RepID=A0ABT2FX43_9CORY|nr:hypothetical protein [Corynebacterium lemuris]MCS5479811.1 hypothetical protein [Corynebacterium lemuris]
MTDRNHPIFTDKQLTTLQEALQEFGRVVREWADTYREAITAFHDQLHDTRQRAGNRQRSMKYQPPPRTLTHNINPTGHPVHRVARSYFPRRHTGGR